MNILYICHRVPYPPKRGGKIRPYNMIAHLSQNHRVTVASLARTEQERQEAQGLTAHCEALICEVVEDPGAYARMLLRAPTRVPSSMGYFYSRRLQQRIVEAVARQKFDLIFVHCSSVAQYVSQIDDIPKILDFGDMDSQKWLMYARLRAFPLKIAYWLEGVKLEREERRLAASFDVCTCTTRQELDTLNDYQAARSTDWFPNGVDAAHFTPAQAYDPDLITFVGRMDYYPNQECVQRFCRESFPLIRQQRPQARFVIVGADPPAFIRRLGELPGVEVTGSVPDTRPYVSGSAVNVATLSIARGTQNKILEAMAMGVPVVASTLAARGVDVVPGTHLLGADRAEDIANAVVAVLSDRALRARLSEQGRARVESHHNWSKSMQQLDRVIAAALRQATPAESQSLEESTP